MKKYDLKKKHVLEVLDKVDELVDTKEKFEMLIKDFKEGIEIYEKEIEKCWDINNDEIIFNSKGEPIVYEFLREKARLIDAIKNTEIEIGRIVNKIDKVVESL